MNAHHDQISTFTGRLLISCFRVCEMRITCMITEIKGTIITKNTINATSSVVPISLNTSQTLDVCRCPPAILLIFQYLYHVKIGKSSQDILGPLSNQLNHWKSDVLTFTCTIRNIINRIYHSSTISHSFNCFIMHNSSFNFIQINNILSPWRHISMDTDIWLSQEIPSYNNCEVATTLLQHHHQSSIIVIIINYLTSSGPSIKWLIGLICSYHISINISSYQYRTIIIPSHYLQNAITNPSY